MLKETGLNTKEVFKKYSYKILYGISEKGYTRLNDFESVETDVWAVESNSFSFDEYLMANSFILIYNFFMSFGYLKEMVYVWENRGVKIADVIQELINNPGAYPFIAAQVKMFNECIKNNLFKTREEANEALIKRFSKNKDSDQYIGFMDHFILSEIIHGEMINFSNQDTMINEVVKASLKIFDKLEKGNRLEFLKEVEFAKVIVKNIILPFWKLSEPEVAIASPFDLVAWRNNDYHGTLHDFLMPNPVIYNFKICLPQQYSDFVRDNAGKPFYIQSELFFRTFRSNNIRRFIVSDVDCKERDKVLLN